MTLLSSPAPCTAGCTSPRALFQLLPYMEAGRPFPAQLWPPHPLSWAGQSDVMQEALVGRVVVELEGREE